MRRRKDPIQTVCELDAFPKVADTYKRTSTAGGTISFFCVILILSLVYSETKDFVYSGVKFHFTPDDELDSKMDLNVDMTVAMPCRYIGADVLDTTGQSVLSFGQLEEEDTWFELSPTQQNHFFAAQRLNNMLREKNHGIQQLLWKSGYQRIFGDMPKRETIPNKATDACRLHGVLHLTKVAGNFHITAGKVLPLPMLAHAHIAPFMDDEKFNYSHRINQFSFGPRMVGLVHPLEGDELVASQGSTMYQYFIMAVPTEIESLVSAASGMHGSIQSWQYSVRNQSRVISHHHNSHGIPGIYFKYDVAPLRVRVVPDAPPIWRFILRLCAIVGGVYTSAGLVHHVLQGLYWLLCSRRNYSELEQTN